MGQTGPWRDRVTYADALAALSGITAETGSIHGGPAGVAFGLGDMIASLHAVIGTLAALEERGRTGEGREIDLSQLEAMASHTGNAMLEAALRLGSTSPVGNRNPRMSPHGAFPCAGDDRWCAIAVENDAEWRALCVVTGNPSAAEDPRLATLAGRQEQEDVVDALVSQWTRQREPAAAAAVLQEAGIPAAPVENGRDLVEDDEHLRARGFYVALRHPVAGEFLHEGICVRLADTPGRIERPAPTLGQHTDEVLRELLGLDERELVRLRTDGALE
jgi:crotonobetainyl-CoA:carnitine CoA-transferase CaiB-like acyl-CoA transferase